MILLFICLSPESELSLSNNEDNKLKVEREQAAAIRSQQTNFCILFVFLLLPMINVFLDFNYLHMIKSSIILNSIQKCLVPVLTTIVNFGTIQEVLMEYVKIVGQKISHTQWQFSSCCQMKTKSYFYFIVMFLSVVAVYVNMFTISDNLV